MKNFQIFQFWPFFDDFLGSESQKDLEKFWPRKNFGRKNARHGLLKNEKFQNILWNLKKSDIGGFNMVLGPKMPKYVISSGYVVWWGAPRQVESWNPSGGIFSEILLSRYRQKKIAILSQFYRNFIAIIAIFIAIFAIFGVGLRSQFPPPAYWNHLFRLRTRALIWVPKINFPIFSLGHLFGNFFSGPCPRALIWALCTQRAPCTY